jgi:acyl carrier protein
MTKSIPDRLLAGRKPIVPSYETEVRAFIVENFLFGEDGDGLTVRDSLLEKGIIDSTGILELVGFVQEKFGLRIEDHEIVPANLDSIEKIVQFIRQKTGDASGQDKAGL